MYDREAYLKRKREHPELIKACAKRWRQKEGFKEATKRYLKTDKGKKQAMKNGMKGYIKYRYGITIEQKHQMFISQDGKCAICGSLFESFEKACIDHEHNTTPIKVRQLLCKHCNTGLGYIRENPNTARAMADYLDKWRRNV